MSNPFIKTAYDINRTCRACLEDKIILNSIINGYLHDMFIKFTNLEVAEDDELPSNLCSFCTEKLSSSLSFLDLCLKSDNILKEYKAIKSEDDDVILENAQVTNTVVSNISVNNFLEENYSSKGENEPSINNRLKEEGSSALVEDNIQSYIDYEESDEYINEEVVEEEKIKEKHKKRPKKNAVLQNKRAYGKEQINTLKPTESLKAEISNYNLSLTCPKCSEEFSKADRLEAHYRVHLGRKPELCEICNKGFSKLERLESHLKQHPKCSVCGEMFATKSFLRIHKKTHASTKKYMCHICGKSFGRNLKVHMALKHCDDKPFPCNVCPLAFKTAAVLKMHLMRHAGTKKYICSTCGFGAVRRWELERHMSSHSDEKRFACKFCPNKYKRQQNLFRHSKVHTGERPHQCDLCPMSFRAKTVLRNHRMLHTGEKPHVCSICSKAFTQKIALVSHMKVHK